MLVICVSILVLLALIVVLPFRLYRKMKWKKELLQKTSEMSYDDLQDYADLLFTELEENYSYKKNYEFELIIDEIHRRRNED